MGKNTVEATDGKEKHNVRITKPLPQNRQSLTRSDEKVIQQKSKKRKYVEPLAVKPVHLTECSDENAHDENVCTGCKKPRTDANGNTDKPVSDRNSGRRLQVEDAIEILTTLKKMSEDQKKQLVERSEHTRQAIETGRSCIEDYFRSLKEILQDREESLRRKLRRLEVFSSHEEAMTKVDSTLAELDGLLQEGKQLLQYSPSKLPVITDAFINRVEKQLSDNKNFSKTTSQGKNVQLNVVYPYLQLNIVYPFDLKECLCNFGQVKMKYAGCNTSNSVKVSFGDLPKDQHIPITDSFGDLPKDQHIPITDSFGDLPKDQHIPITDSFGDLPKDQHIPVTDSCHDGSTSNGIPPSTETSSSNQQVCVSASDKLNSDVMDTLPTILSVQTLAKGTQEAVDNIDHLQHSKAIFLDANGDVVHVTVDNYVDLSGQLYTDGKLDSQTLGGKDHLNNHVLVSSQTQLLNTTSVSVQTSGEHHTDQLTQCDSTSNVELENGCSSSADAQESSIPMKEKSLKLSDRSKSNANSKQSTKKDTASKHAKCVDDGIRYKLAPKKTKSITGMTVTKKTSPSKRQRNAQAEKKTKEQRKSCANISRKNSEVESSENKRLSLPSSDPIIWVRRRRDGVTSAELKKCNDIMTALWAVEDSWPFVKPVSRKEVPDYYDLIKTPVDLTSIRNKIDSIEYDSAYDFVKDMVLLFSNCESYNTSDSETYKQGKSLQDLFSTLWKKEFPTYEFKKVKFR